MSTEKPIETPSSNTPKPETRDDAEFIVTLGNVESLTFGGGKEFEDNGAAYQRG